MTTPSYTDEQLMAYADGELDAATATRIRTAALHDAALARRITGFEHTGRSLGASFNDTLNAPVPDHLLQLLQAPPARETVQPLRPAATASRLARWWPTALAASLALAVGLSINLPSGDAPVPAAIAPLLAGLPADPALLSRVLENTPSGEPVTLAEAGRDYEVLPTASYREADGRYCREFNATDLGSDSQVHGLACRGGDAQWAIELATLVSRVAVVQDEGYFPAGSESPGGVPRSPLETSAEQALIAAGWAR